MIVAVWPISNSATPVFAPQSVVARISYTPSGTALESLTSQLDETIRVLANVSPASGVHDECSYVRPSTSTRRYSNATADTPASAQSIGLGFSTSYSTLPSCSSFTRNASRVRSSPSPLAHSIAGHRHTSDCIKPAGFAKSPLWSVATTLVARFPAASATLFTRTLTGPADRSSGVGSTNDSRTTAPSHPSRSRLLLSVSNTTSPPSSRLAPNVIEALVVLSQCTGSE